MRVIQSMQESLTGWLVKADTLQGERFLIFAMDKKWVMSTLLANQEGWDHYTMHPCLTFPTTEKGHLDSINAFISPS